MLSFKNLLAALLLIVAFSTFSTTYANDNDVANVLKKHHVGLKFSLISHSGLYYGNQLNETWYLSFGGFWYFESSAGNIDSIIELGVELQHSLYRSNGFDFYTLAGLGFQNDKDYKFGDRHWIQYGIGLGVSSQSTSGLTLNVDCGILRYRKITGPNKDRVIIGFGLGFGIGYKF